MTTDRTKVAATPALPPSPRLPPARRPISRWVPVLLICLALLTLIGGLTIGDFYWNDLRPDMGRIGSNLAQVRDRQRVMLGNFAEAQALFLEQQRLLVTRVQELRRREQAVYEARLEIDAQRAQLAQELEAETERRRIAVARLAQAADQADTAAQGLTSSDSLAEARAAIALTQALLTPLPGAKAESGRTALAAAEAQLAAVQPVDRATLAKRLDTLRGKALVLRPVRARLLRAKRNGDQGQQERGSNDDPVTQASRSLESQFQAAHLALESADTPGFVAGMQGIDRWLSAFYEPRLPDTATVLTEVRAMAALRISAEVAPLSTALEHLAATLRGMTEAPGDK